jgi:hypothetical protein
MFERASILNIDPSALAAVTGGLFGSSPASPADLDLFPLSERECQQLGSKPIGKVTRDDLGRWANGCQWYQKLKQKPDVPELVRKAPHYF